MESKYCHSCGEQIAKTASTCPKCGAPQAGSVSHLISAATPRNKTLTVVFALILGAFGVHKFYLRQYVAGVIYLLFFWTYIPGLIALVEGSRFVFMSDADFDNRYNDGQQVNKSGPLAPILAAVTILMAIIAVLSIIVAIALPAYQDYRKRAEARSNKDKPLSKTPPARS
ncbi:MAG: hypothetical protein CGU28_16975 [Candidatus Dactylopiibacterium carminicum]|uniref:TM2 domain-containing protein n=1 Tax=Candidatus Dactylopiibacterium carminicum TaxID=857335 RepID=A0A272ENT3_9RHOO|nr:TM2 domain-containing protein [Candidatus Dactylopiibacterium carminicum]KAF7597723.1 hypothetical protein BGI27_17245 [Candidatus Dactylopiibacterium carminicum]PAS91330.1 MAG: hypothetical protein CGU29_17055 [Candidatus Dactylopiibacterium carminicum]PAS92164.1 MAG: hypothetical protein CGU28_16975 [Candidatus Dactylopiibacterium carminicum]PAS94746.1 MAG: hypothetical protein BSR46_17285 [Candidatus Dactylopiibacterium carminicum]